MLANAVAPLLVGTSLADIGCGSGIFGFYFRAIGQVEKSIGVDFSERAVEFLRERKVYDEVYLANSASLPLPDQVVDVSLSMENLEHLYPPQVPHALEELTRIARQRIVITTPAPWDVINRPFLAEEISAARNDRDPLDYSEFRRLAGYAHVSWVDPEQMADAGFCFARNKLGAAQSSQGSMVYWADPANVTLSTLGMVGGLSRAGLPPDDGRDDWRDEYVSLLQEIDAQRTPAVPRSLGILHSGATIIAGVRGLARLGR